MPASRPSESVAVNELQFADDVLARIRAQGGAYHERAYLFVLATIEYLQSRLEVRRHVSGRRAGLGLPRLRPGAVRAPRAARARPLGHHPDRGLSAGIVFTLVEVGLLVTQPGDLESDFEAVYEFADAFGDVYDWQGVRGA